MTVGQLVAMLHRPKGAFKGLHISASETTAVLDGYQADTIVNVSLPRELQPTEENIVVFCMITWPGTNKSVFGEPNVYERRLVGLSVGGKTVSGLREHVNITMKLTMDINENKQPSCVFLNYSSSKYDDHGCVTHWEPGLGRVTCSCNHLTYFAVLMVSPSLQTTDLVNLSYITLIGCSLSLCALVVTLLLFITKRGARSDINMKIHINLVFALILLNVHFLPSQQVAALSSPGFCIYMALLLHYSLLATFSWMSLEGFHLYLLLVRVYNIYVRRYLLKLCLLGWGIPLVIVIMVAIIDPHTYGQVPLGFSGTNSTVIKICYVSSTLVKMVTTMGLFSIVFIFNLAMLIVTVRRILALHHHEMVQFGQEEKGRAKKDACMVLGITCLLGITWGLVFFSFGHLTTPGIYLFCILNSLQGVFICLWFCTAMLKTDGASANTGSETRSTSG
ncbi:adhesion G-protein coupled receptor G5-like [Myripristis murdjan]|uniref:adhesion G-protein coupled receptor G5-like n=1 Tax=Myripristis murdjan TaxID=586833 RepID=UPI0011760DD6|nr:adhesion G-protein coupled receptor G5-like [Myripristis murdjan]